MGKSPLPLWTVGTDDPERPRRPLEGNWRDLFAQVDRALAMRGISTAETEFAEVWEVGAMIGANDPDPDVPPADDGTEDLTSLAEGFDRTLLE